MSHDPITRIAEELRCRPSQVGAVQALFAEGATVPFIARYRKERTGSLDEVQVLAIRDRFEALEKLELRRASMLSSLEERSLLTDDLRAKLTGAEALSKLEDLYLPFRPKRRTRAQKARERGLEPLADLVQAQRAEDDPRELAAPFVDPAKEVTSVDDALAGARDVIAERVAEDADARAELRALYEREAALRTRVLRGKEEEGKTYRDYFDWAEPARTAPSHRVLAARRGEAAGVLAMRIEVPVESATALLVRRFVSGTGAAADEVRQAIADSYKRLLGPAMETEVRLAAKKRADEEAIRVFAENLRELLLAPPLGGKRVLAIDPGFRTGCKVVCLGPEGQLVHDDVIYPHTSGRGYEAAAAKVQALCARFHTEAVAVGNGTAGRETEAFLRKLDLPGKPPIVLVNESGASIYSASEVAREELGDTDLTVRGTVSIGRRLMDPLAELVKLDPRSIGVGQYQHDVDQRALKAALDDTVTSCVNGVGVQVNTASRQLLRYVAGLTDRLAKSIVEHRAQHGPFPSRRSLKKVRGLGAKTFEQAAGFLRIPDAEHPLDRSAVHPERYPVVQAMAQDLGLTLPELLQKTGLRARIDLRRYVTDDVGLPTLEDILQELEKPGRDPREQFEPMRFAEGVHELTDLKPGMRLDGVVTNVTNFGAFIDVGVHQDGLCHISQLADHFVERPADVVKVGQRVSVRVLEVDLDRKRISLSMRRDARPADAEKTGRGAAV